MPMVFSRPIVLIHSEQTKRVALIFKAADETSYQKHRHAIALTDSNKVIGGDKQTGAFRIAAAPLPANAARRNADGPPLPSPSLPG